MRVYFMRQDKRTPFDALSLLDVQIVSAGDTNRAGIYYGLVSITRPRYASRTLMRRRFTNEQCLQLGLVSPVRRFTDRTVYQTGRSQRTVMIIGPAPYAVKARAGVSANYGRLRLRLACLWKSVLIAIRISRSYL